MDENRFPFTASTSCLPQANVYFIVITILISERFSESPHDRWSIGSFLEYNSCTLESQLKNLRKHAMRDIDVREEPEQCWKVHIYCVRTKPQAATGAAAKNIIKNLNRYLWLSARFHGKFHPKDGHHGRYTVRSNVRPYLYCFLVYRIFIRAPNLSAKMRWASESFLRSNTCPRLECTSIYFLPKFRISQSQYSVLRSHAAA